MEEKILKKLKLKISISKIKEEKKSVTDNKKSFINKKISIAACACLILTTGVVFAKDIENLVKYYFGLNESVNKAAESGYVEEINANVIEEKTLLEDKETGTVIDDVEVALKFDEFVMDDLVLSTNMTFEFDEKIKDVFDLDKLTLISIEDLIIIDEENRIILADTSMPEFNNLKQKYKLSQEFGEYGENYYNCSYGTGLLNHDKENNILKYNIEINASDMFFPKSKELRFLFSKIKLEKYEEYIGQDIENGEYLKSNYITLSGDWEFKFEVPEKMYNRTNIEYEVVSISDPDVDVYYSACSETGFCLGAIFSNITEPEYPNYEYLEKLEKRWKGRRNY